MVLFPSLIQFHSEREQGVEQKQKKYVKFGDESVCVEESWSRKDAHCSGNGRFGGTELFRYLESR